MANRIKILLITTANQLKREKKAKKSNNTINN
jgi:hypothetical protein